MTYGYGAYLGWKLGVDYPEWANTQPYVETISKGYLLPNETPRDAYTRVANSIATYLNKPELAPKFFDYIWRGWLCLASPVLANCGTTRGLPISCYGIELDDSIYSLGSKNLEMMVMAKNGGGVGINMSSIRPAGSPITNNGTSDGIVPFCKIYDSSILATNQGGTRKGSVVINLDIDHKDFEEWLEIREPKGDINRQSLNIHQCAVISNDFMRRVEAGDEVARRKWSKLLYKRKTSGEPYCLFIDNVNNSNPPAYKNNNLKVSMTNLCCLTGDTEVITTEGSYPISDLVGKTVDIWDGNRWVTNSNFQLVTVSDDIYEIELDNEVVIRATGNHKWYVVNEYKEINNTPYSVIETTDLTPGQLLESHSYGLREHGANHKGFYVVKQVVKLNITEPVYCTNVPTTHKFALSCGVMTGNSEITLYTDPYHSFVCCLSSLNLAKYHEWHNTDLVETAIWFLDGVMSEFIDKAKQIKGMECAVRFSEKSRALGLGTLGWNTFLQQEGLPFDSKEANQWTVTIFKQIKDLAYKASQDLAKEYGEPEWCVGTGMRNTHTCVTGDTYILTKDGQIHIKDLVGKQIEIWNGDEWSVVTPYETGESELLEIKFSNGITLKCTPDHKFLVATPKRDTKTYGGLKTIEVEARNLRINDCLPKFFTEASGTEQDLPYAYESGLFCGDGSINCSRNGKYPRKELRLYHDKKKLSSFIQWKSSTLWGDSNMIRGYLPDEVLDKYIVPLNYSVLSKQQWLAGLVDSDGYADSKGISISMKDYNFAMEVALLVQSLGGEPYIHIVKRKGGYPGSSSVAYTVSISQFSINNVFSLFTPKRVKVNVCKNQCKTGKRHLVEIISITKLAKSEMTYCFTEPIKGLGVFNGILTKQCATAPTVSNSKLSGNVSPGIEPWAANIYTEQSAKGNFIRKNKLLEEVLEHIGINNDETWRKIMADNGSIQGIDQLEDWYFVDGKLDNHKLQKPDSIVYKVKDVFKTFVEINQIKIVHQQAIRQQYIDQAVSLNLKFPADVSPRFVNDVHMEAWRIGLKTLYYMRSESVLKADTGLTTMPTCQACDG